MTRPAVATPADFAAWTATQAAGIVFAGPDPHYGIGLEELVPGFRILCINPSPAVDILRARGIDVLVLDEEGVDVDADGERSTASLLGRPRARAFLSRRGSAWDESGGSVGGAAAPHILVFKSSHALEVLCRSRGWSLVAPPARLARHWENKVVFRQLAADLGLNQPPGMAVDLARSSYAAIARSLGPRVVLQAAHGFSGARTYLVTDASEFSVAVDALRGRTVRATAFIPGRSLTLNACVTARGIAVGAPFLQVTGEPTLTRYSLGACGNDWNALADDPPDPAPFVTAATVVGEALAAQAYRGIFGLDFVVAEDGRVYVIEVNPRLVASIALYTQLELLAGRLPLLARHLLAFVDPEADRAPLDLHLAPVRGAQVILHNVAAHDRLVRGSLVTGVYRWLELTGELALMRPAVRVDAIEVPGEILVLAPDRGRKVKSGQAFGRIQTRGGVVDAAGRLLPEIAVASRAIADAVDLAAP